MDHSGIIKKTRVKQKINKTRDENRFLSKSIYTRARVQCLDVIKHYYKRSAIGFYERAINVEMKIGQKDIDNNGEGDVYQSRHRRHSH